MKTANMTVRHELILISYMFVLKGATRHGEAPFYKHHKEALTMNAGCEPVYFGDESKR